MAIYFNLDFNIEPFSDSVWAWNKFHEHWQLFFRQRFQDSDELVFGLVISWKIAVIFIEKLGNF